MDGLFCHLDLILNLARLDLNSAVYNHCYATPHCREESMEFGTSIQRHCVWNTLNVNTVVDQVALSYRCLGQFERLSLTVLSVFGY